MSRTIRRTILFVIFISLMVSIFSPFMGVEVSADGANPTTLTSSPVIQVNNDTELASLISTNSWKGTGTLSDPYIIENLKINSTDNQYGIYLGNVSKHLTIDNCQVYSDNVSWPGYVSVAGIALLNSTGLFLENNNCSGNAYGIYLRNSSNNNTITNNRCNGNAYGISVQDFSSDNNTISNNDFSKNAVGMQLLATRHNIITNNDFSGNDLGLYGGTGIDMGFSDNNTISNNTCGGKDYGIEMFFSSNNSIFNNNCSGKEYGIYLEINSQNNQFVANTGTIFVNTGTGIDTDGGSVSQTNTTAVFLISVVIFAMVTAYVLLGRRKPV